MAWNFDSLAIEDYPGWERTPEGKPFFVMMERVYRKDEPAMQIENSFDDISKQSFYGRDWTKSGLPFVQEEDVFWSGFWFQCKEDAEKFVELFGGVGNWMPNFEEFNKLCNRKRSGEI